MKKALLFGIAAPLLSLIMGGLLALYLVKFWSYQGPEKRFTIVSGEPFSRINYKLKQEKLISSARLFHRYSAFKNVVSQFKPGKYTFTSGTRMDDIIAAFLKGAEDLTSVTIPEGKNLYEIAQILSKAKICSEKDFILAAKNSSLTEKYNIPSATFEGYLYPETYFLSEDMPPDRIIDTMVKQFEKKTATLNFLKSKLSKHEVVTLASIVEKETGAGFERSIISGVFHNRLKKRMRLQSDPTTIYGIWENFNGNLRKKHLLQKTPYNTYKISALPIGPISNPGIESLKAAISPEAHDYYYFVSYNDGTHKFSKTYSEHLQAVKKFQKDRSQRVGKSWRDLKEKR